MALSRGRLVSPVPRAKWLGLSTPQLACLGTGLWGQGEKSSFAGIPRLSSACGWKQRGLASADAA